MQFYTTFTSFTVFLPGELRIGLSYFKLSQWIAVEKIKKISSQLGIEKIKISNNKCKIYFGNLKEEKLMKLIEKLKPDYIYSDYFEVKVSENFLVNLYNFLREININ